jgi:hypothetical protein
MAQRSRRNDDGGPEETGANGRAAMEALQRVGLLCFGGF